MTIAVAGKTLVSVALPPASIEFKYRKPNPIPVVSSERFAGFSRLNSSELFTIGSSSRTNDGGNVNSGTAHIFSNTTGALLWTVLNPNASGTTENDYFGNASAISDTHAIVGAPLEDDAFLESGAAYIINPATGGVLHTLTNPSPEVGANFGQYVATSDLYCAVSAPDYLSNVGVVYIFDNATGSLQHTLISPNSFTSSLALDMTDTHLIVGDTASKTVWIYDVVTGNLLHTLINTSDGQPPDPNFGTRVAIGNTQFAVGAGESTLGKARVYNLATATWVRTHDIPYSGNVETLGGLSISDRYVAFGRPRDDTFAGDSGMVVVYSAVDGTLLYEVDAGGGTNAAYGSSVSVGENYLAACATGETVGGFVGSGVIYIHQIIPAPGT